MLVLLLTKNFDRWFGLSFACILRCALLAATGNLDLLSPAYHRVRPLRQMWALVNLSNPGWPFIFRFGLL